MLPKFTENLAQNTSTYLTAQNESDKIAMCLDTFKNIVTFHNHFLALDLMQAEQSLKDPTFKEHSAGETSTKHHEASKRHGTADATQPSSPAMQTNNSGKELQNVLAHALGSFELLGLFVHASDSVLPEGQDKLILSQVSRAHSSASCRLEISLLHTRYILQPWLRSQILEERSNVYDLTFAILDILNRTLTESYRRRKSLAQKPKGNAARENENPFLRDNVITTFVTKCNWGCDLMTLLCHANTASAVQFFDPILDLLDIIDLLVLIKYNSSHGNRHTCTLLTSLCPRMSLGSCVLVSSCILVILRYCDCSVCSEHSSVRDAYKLLTLDHHRGVVHEEPTGAWEKTPYVNWLFDLEKLLSSDRDRALETLEEAESHKLKSLMERVERCIKKIVCSSHHARLVYAKYSGIERETHAFSEQLSAEMRGKNSHHSETA